VSFRPEEAADNAKQAAWARGIFKGLFNPLDPHGAHDLDLDVNAGDAASQAEWNWQIDQVKAARAALLAREKKASKRHLKLQHKPTAAELAQQAQIDAAVAQAKSSADQIKSMMATNETASWPTWVGVGLVSAGVIGALLIGPELLAAAALVGTEEAAATAAATIIDIAATSGIRTVSVAAFVEGADLQTGGAGSEILAELVTKLTEAGLHVVDVAPEVIYRNAK
jgi:hypothetical protein